MPAFDIERLQAIKTLSSLIVYLRDELGWPIEQDAVEDDLTFDYSADELGITAESAVGIKEIKQLRPLDHRQPWGVFWVNFEKKRLPVAMLRRVLGHLVVKRRASAAGAKRRAWHLHDLLFISSYGEESDRAITFAHFSHDPESPGDLPVLKVLGWDGGDTILHLADAHQTLAAKLRWPADPGDLAGWRQQWGAAFTLGHRQVIKTSEELEQELAHLALSIRRCTALLLAKESDKGPLRRLYGAFQAALIHDLTEDDFADVMAQTLTYGLLIAKFSRPAGICVDNLVDMIPETNPFLRELLQTFLEMAGKRGKLNFDELGIQDVVEMLNHADTEAVKCDFGNKTRQEDPVIHFYEHFLAVYDKAKKVQRGVFYTPQPVVSYIVRSVHELLQTEFGLEDGLASTVTWGEFTTKYAKDTKIPEGAKADEYFVNILDPATGTATFLVEVIEVVFNHLREKWRQKGADGMPCLPGKPPPTGTFADYWNEYVPAALLPRLYGYELMMAPYTIAHMKLGLKLSEINTRLGQPGHHFTFGGRAHIYLTNSLEPAYEEKVQREFESFFPALAHEAVAVTTVKRLKVFTVVVGNPPYSTLSQNMGDWARGIVDPYFHDDSGRMTERGNRNQLQDDYVKFFRLGQMVVSSVGVGVLGFISNSSYIRGPWFRGMRYQLMEAFDRISILDLHGSQAHSLDTTEGDQNVFEITTPVVIGLLRMGSVCRSDGEEASVTYGEIHGSRDRKYKELDGSSLRSVAAVFLKPTRANQWRFVPHDDANQDEWVVFTALPDVFVSWGAGVLTNRNGLAVADSRGELLRKVRRFADLTIGDAEIEADYGFASNYQWATGKARRDFARHPVKDLTEPYTFRPFDFQYIYWHKNIVYNMRGDKMEVFRTKTPPLGLMFSRNTKHGQYTNVYVTRRIPDRHCLEEANVAALHTVASADELFSGHRISLHCNLSEVFLAKVREHFASDGEAPTPDTILNYMYAVLHSPGYRSRYAAFLKIDFPHLPLPHGLDLFRSVASFGDEIVALHLMESPSLSKHITKWVADKSSDVEKVSYSDKTVWIDRARTTGFRGVPEHVWNFHIGGYQVCEKWLKDRKGRALSADDIEHYQKVVVALSETIRIMGEIDMVIEKHGGWPGAFVTEKVDLGVS